MATQLDAKAACVLIVACEYLVQAAGALAASGHPPVVNGGQHPRQRVQISPFSSPLGTSPGS
jgi:hypothetical protein